ncbi:DUF6252 family protein [Flavobacterium sedimenticola]|uniref:DUF6252 family protein n=1 Tax=Flavobacterium sedimenticola TaxID=3043286 RepID=A0ABT6XN66_9FLAO|nr:DUF6252 family protein [Flavobacterium sedimenticola]MDI9256458.1 DUF6252 family protein [Flavobacterium sedimenticola]
MKRFLSLILIAIAFTSCQEDVKFNDPGLQALKDDVFWRASDTRAYLTTDGKLTIEAYTQFELLSLSTASANEGVYLLGSTNINNAASYSSEFNGVELEYATVPVPGPVSNIAIADSGTGYTTTSGSSVATTGGSGSGLTVKVVANAGGNVTSATVVSRGNGYVAGDLVIVSGGNLNCKLRVVNVQNSNGQIEILEYDNVNMTISGKFKFNAVNTNASPFGGPILNFQYGEFYKIPIFPSI